ncbi:hypothetical protein [Mucilaginibacter aquaedulcis]
MSTEEFSHLEILGAIIENSEAKGAGKWSTYNTNGQQMTMKNG